MSILSAFEEVVAHLDTILDNHEISHFSADEFLRRRCGIPPLEIVGNIIPTALVLEELRDHFGRPCLITSGYRSPAYNKRIGGAEFSTHVMFNAVDIVVVGVVPHEVYEWLDAHPHSHRFGLGDGVSFTHFDTRGTLDGPYYEKLRELGAAAPARWDYS